MRNKEHHPQIGFGLFLIILGIALLVATNDFLHLGSISNYFTWQTAMVFIGAILLVNLNFVGGLLLIAGGVWLYIGDHDMMMPAYLKTLYWPGVIILLGLSFIASSVIKRRKINN